MVTSDPSTRGRFVLESGLSPSNWRFYQNAFNPLLDMLIIGPPSSRSLRELQEAFGISSNTDGRQARTVPATFDDPRMVHQGSLMYEKNYCPLLNDVWVLGGVHRCIPFHLKSFPTHKKLIPDSALWKDGDDRMGMLARELLMLRQFGYCRVLGDEHLGAVFVPADRGRATRAELRDFIAAVSQGKYQNKQNLIDDISAFLDSGISYSDYTRLQREFLGLVTRPLIVHCYEPGTHFGMGPWMNVTSGEIYAILGPRNTKGPLHIHLVDASYEQHIPGRAQVTTRFDRNVSGWVDSYEFLQKHFTS